MHTPARHARSKRTRRWLTTPDRNARWLTRTVAHARAPRPLDARLSLAVLMPPKPKKKIKPKSKPKAKSAKAKAGRRPVEQDSAEPDDPSSGGVAEHDDPSSGGLAEHVKSPLEEYPVFQLPIPSKTNVASPGLRKPEVYVENLVLAMLDRMSAQEQHAVWCFLLCVGPRISLASVCAGTDSPRIVLNTIMQVLTDRLGKKFKDDTPPEMVHAFSSEINEHKRDFLKRMYNSQPEREKLFGDVRQVSQSEAPDYCKEDDAPSKVPRFNVLVGGSPCKDVSTCNNQRLKHQNGITKKTGKTGGAFGGIIDLIKAHGEDLVFSVFENVLGLGTAPTLTAPDGSKQKGSINESNLAASLSMLDTEADQFAFACHLDPRNFAGPQSRGRFWMPAFSRAALAKLNVSEQEAYQWTTQYLGRFNDHGYSTIDDVLLPDDHPFIQEYISQAKQKACPWDGPPQECKWPQAHHDHARTLII
jgi:hypothetical protein